MPKNENANVTRIKASGSSSSKSASQKTSNTKKVATKATTRVATDTTSKVKKTPQGKSTSKNVKQPNDKKIRNPFAPIGRYFKGAWYELRQVRWPDRKATWSMTGALLLFTAFFVVLILLLDAGFQYLFKLIIG